MMTPLRAARRSLLSSRPAFTSVRAASTSSAPTTPPRLRSYFALSFAVLSTGLFSVYYFDSRASIHRYFLAPALRLLDPEDAHRLAVRTIGAGFAPRDLLANDARLKTELWGMTLESPIGLAAGFDKDGEAVDGLFGLGFSWVEIGSVTPKPQPGNPRPRVFRLPADESIINRYGFPSAGHAAVFSRLRSRSHTPPTSELAHVLAVNLGKNKDSAPDDNADYVAGVHAFAPHADVLVVNVSSPNTPGLRALQARDALQSLLTDVVRARDETPTRPRLVLKIAPDLDERQLLDVADVVRGVPGVDGVIVSNTTVQRPAGILGGSKTEAGGFSGPALRPLALRALRTLRSQLPSSITLIGCGGIASGADALDYARAGASAVQIYTSFVYDGAGAARRIKDEVCAELMKEGKTWADVVKGAVEDLAWRPSDAGDAQTKLDVKQLIREAEQLKEALDALAARNSAEREGTHTLEAGDVVPPAAAAVGAV